MAKAKVQTSAEKLAEGLAKGEKVRRNDGWVNALSGLGTSRDKTMAATFELEALLSPEQCEAMFTQDDLANTVVTALVDDACREGFTLEPSDPDADPDESREAAAELCERIKALEAWPTLREGAIWGRLYGRGGVLVVTRGSQSAPLTDAAEIVCLVAVDRQELSPRTYYTDQFHVDYGKPETYQLSRSASGGPGAAEIAIVHASRLILFPGADTPKRVRAINDGCDLSVLQKVYTTLRGVNGTWSSVQAMMADMSQGVIKMQGLIDAVIEGRSDEISARITLMDQMRSVARSILLDAGAEGESGEDFSYVERSLAGVADLIDRNFTRLAAAAQTPVTRLFGISPAGLNATGEGDRKSWHDRVRAYQRDILAPALLRLVKILDPEGEWIVSFPDLEKMDPGQTSKLRLETAQTDKIYLDAGVVLPAEIALSRFGSGKYSTETDIDLESRETRLEDDLKALEEGGGIDQPDATGAQGQGGQGGPANAQKPGAAGANAKATGGGRAAKPPTGGKVGRRVSARR